MTLTVHVAPDAKLAPDAQLPPVMAKSRFGAPSVSATGAPSVALAGSVKVSGTVPLAWPTGIVPKSCAMPGCTVSVVATVQVQVAGALRTPDPF